VASLRPFNPLVAALSRLLHLPAARAGDWVARVIDQAASESTQRGPGAEAVLERLAEMMFVDTARCYLESLPASLPERLTGKTLSERVVQLPVLISPTTISSDSSRVALDPQKSGGGGSGHV